MKQPFHEWIAEVRRKKELRQEDCAERVCREFPPRQVKRNGRLVEIPALTRQGWCAYEKETPDRLHPETIKKIAVGLGEPESVVIAAAPEYDRGTISPSERFRVLLAKRLQQAREGRYTQEELGNLTGLGRAAIAHYENASSEPPAYALFEIARTLEVDLNDLCGIQPARGDIGVRPAPAVVTAIDKGIVCALENLAELIQTGFQQLGAQQTETLRLLLESR